MDDGSRPQLDRIPPHDAEAEAAVVGILMIPEAARAHLGEVRALLSPADFYLGAHQHVFAAICALEDRGATIDLIAVKDELRRADDALRQIGGPDTLVRIMEGWDHPAGLIGWARIVADKAALRRAIVHAQKVLTAAYEPSADPAEVLDLVETSVASVRSPNSVALVPVRELVQRVLEDLDGRKDKPNARGYGTGIADLDDVFSMRPGELITVAARPSRGKTSLGMAIALRMTSHYDLDGDFFSLETRGEKIAEHMLAMASGVDSSRLESGSLEERDWRQIMEIGVPKIVGSDGLRFHLLDQGRTPITTIESLARQSALASARAGRRYGFVVVDYLQLVRPAASDKRTAGTRQEEVASISARLKGLALDLGCCVIALCQLNRMADDEDRPRMRHIRESGAVENDSDSVIALHRPNFEAADGEVRIPASASQEAEIGILKQRNGGNVGRWVSCLFLGSTRRFVDKVREMTGFRDYQST